MRSLACISVLFAAVVAVAGCSGGGAGASVEPLTSGDGPPRPLVLKPDAVRAPRAVSDDASVEPGQIVLPASSADDASWAASLAPGAIIVGNRDTKSPVLADSKNPYGFLRKVVSVTNDGASIVIATEQAYLTDLIDDGDLVLGQEGPSIFPDAITVVPPTTTQSIVPLAEQPTDAAARSGEAPVEGAFSVSGSVTPVIRFSNGRFALNAKFAGQVSFGHTLGIPTSVKKAHVRLDVDPVASVDMEWGGSATKAANLKKTWRGVSVPIPLPGPIPTTLRFHPEVGCSLALTGEVVVRSRLHMTGHAAAGFDYAGGSLDAIDDPSTLDVGHDFIGVQGKATLRGECALSGVLAVLAFDAIGLEGTVGPYAAVEADVCGAASAQAVSGDFAVFEEHGVRADLNGRLQIPGLSVPVVTQPIFSMPSWKNGPNYVVGDELKCNARAKDSCVGKPDGVYCSELADYSAYVCQGGQIASGQQCPSGQKCTGPNGAGTAIQCAPR